jgi:hypothetical protein
MSGFRQVTRSMGVAILLATAPTTAPLAQATPSPMAADDYIVSKFRDHDVVFLGEMHSVRENLDFLQRLIPKLYAAGIRTLGFEFANYADQRTIDTLIAGPRYDEHVALELLWHCCNLKWVTDDYANVFRAAWALNHALPAGAPRFRIVGLDRRGGDSASMLADGERTTRGLTDLPNTVTHINSFDADNFFWAEVLDREVLQSHAKALVYSGEGHAYTRFIHSRGTDGGFTVGNFVYDAIHDRAFTINIHGSASDGRIELARTVDSIFAKLPGGGINTGFDTRSHAIGRLPIREYGCSIEVHPRCDGFSLSDIADGYVYLGPVDSWHSVTFRPDFITAKNYEQVEAAWRAEKPRTSKYSIDELRAEGASALRRQFLYQQGREP